MPYMTGNVMVQFGAKWCQPCKSITPVAEQIANEIGITFYKKDVEEDTDLANHFNVKSVPSFLFLRDGTELGRVQVAVPGQIRQVGKNCFGK